MGIDRYSGGRIELSKIAKFILLKRKEQESKRDVDVERASERSKAKRRRLKQEYRKMVAFVKEDRCIRQKEREEVKEKLEEVDTRYENLKRQKHKLFQQFKEMQNEEERKKVQDWEEKMRNEYLQKAQQYQMAQQMIVSTEGESQIPVRPPASLPLQEGRGLEGVVPLDGVPQGSLTPLELGAASYHGGSSLAPHHQSGPGLLRFLSDPRLKDERKLGLGQSGGPGAQAHTPQGFLGSFSGRFSSGGLSSSDSVQSGNQDTPPPPPLASPSGIRPYQVDVQSPFSPPPMMLDMFRSPNTGYRPKTPSDTTQIYPQLPTTPMSVASGTTLPVMRPPTLDPAPWSVGGPSYVQRHSSSGSTGSSPSLSSPKNPTLHTLYKQQ